MGVVSESILLAGLEVRVISNLTAGLWGRRGWVGGGCSTEEGAWILTDEERREGREGGRKEGREGERGGRREGGERRGGEKGGRMEEERREERRVG